MAKMVLTAAFINLTGPGDVSGSVSKCELTVDVEEKDVTTFSSAGWKEVLGGLKSAGLALTFKNDMAASALDSLMWSVLGTVIAFEVRASNAVVGVSNPKYTGSVLIKSWSPVSGSPGDVNELSVTFPTSGAVVRGTS